MANNELTNENYARMNELENLMANEENEWNEGMEFDTLIDRAISYVERFSNPQNNDNLPEHSTVNRLLSDILAHPLRQQRMEEDPFVRELIMDLQNLEHQLAQNNGHVVLHHAVNYNHPENVGTLFVPAGSQNFVTYETIENGDKMVNFHGERKFNHYYTKNTFDQIVRNYNGLKKNPSTRAVIQENNLKTYTASVGIPDNMKKINTTLFTNGGKRRKTRKERKGRKARKTHRKH